MLSTTSKVIDATHVTTDIDTIVGVSGADVVNVALHVSAVEAGGDLDVTVEWSHDGVNFDADSAAFTKATAATTEIKRYTVLGRHMKVHQAISGGTATAAVVLGTVASDVDFTANAVTFSVAQDGAAAEPVTLDADYTNIAGVVSAVNTQLTGSPASVHDTNKFKLTSPTTGDDSAVVVSAYAEAGSKTAGIANASVAGVSPGVTYTVHVQV